MSKSEINLNVELGKDNVPEKMTWNASQNEKGEQECKAFFLSIFEEDSRETLKIDLWTKKMQVQEMDRFVYYTLQGLRQSYIQATGNEQLAGVMDEFIQFFGKSTEILKEEG